MLPQLARCSTCISGGWYHSSPFSSSPPYIIFMTGLCVEKLITSCRPTFELSGKHFHIFLPAALGQERATFATVFFLSFMFSFNVSLRSQLCSCPFLCPVLSLVKPLERENIGFGFAEHSRTMTEASRLYHCTNAFSN